MTINRYFPIQTETACKLKWNWNTIRLYNGNTSSCHRVDGDIVSAETFDTFHNTPKKLADRTLMLEGQWPTGGCEYCKNIETAGGSSDRLFHLAIPGQIPPELSNNLTAIQVTPTIVEVYLDNVCNMSCIYCWDGFSSRIQQENIQFGRFEKQGVIIDNQAEKAKDFDALSEKFWLWMDTNYKTLGRFHVLGGEPFYQPQFERCLEFLETHKNPELEFNVVTNLKIPRNRLVKIIDRIHRLVKEGQIKRFDLTVSIDCFGPEQEYVRFGMDLDQWRDNFEYLVDQSWITLNINQTLSGLTIKTVPELLQYINPLRSNREIGHYFSTVVMTHNFLHPEIFGPGFFDSDFEKILNNMPENTWQQQQAKKYMQGIHLQINSSQQNQEKINQLVVFLDEIDRRRNLNWKETFPWLVKEIKNVV
jgi:pyruvate-formate lyase-activating enzyme